MSSEATSYFPGSVAGALGPHRREARHSVIDDEPNVPLVDSRIGIPLNSVSENSETASDERLLHDLLDGKKEALSILFRRYARMVRAVAYRILRNGAEADDLVQEVFLFVYRKRNLFDAERGSARSWIIQVAYHRGIDRRRYLTSRHFYTHLELSDAATLGRSLFYEKSIEGVLGRDRLQEIHKSLSADQRRVLELYFYEGYTLEEIAKEMMQAVGNIRNHYYRGLEKMRQSIFDGKMRTK